MYTTDRQNNLYDNLTCSSCWHFLYFLLSKCSLSRCKYWNKFQTHISSSTVKLSINLAKYVSDDFLMVYQPHCIQNYQQEIICSNLGNEFPYNCPCTYSDERSAWSMNLPDQYHWQLLSCSLIFLHSCFWIHSVQYHAY